MDLSSTRARCWRRDAGSLVLLAVSIAACGGGSEPPAPGVPSPPSSGSTPIQIRGTERIGWIQQAQSSAELADYSYRLYIDQVPGRLTDVNCNGTAQPRTYDCSAPLLRMSAGAHVLELSTMHGDLESARSAAVHVVRLVAASDPALTALAPGSHTAPAAADEPIVAELGTVTALSAAPDGRLFSIERGRYVRILEDERLVTAPALSITNPAERIVGLAVDPSFSASRAVVVAVATPRSDGRWELLVTRYRELHGSLAQGAAILSGVPLPAPRQVPIALDGAGRVYVAVPASAGADGRSEGVILRLGTDGFVPDDNPRPSPVMAYGYSEPVTLAVDATHQRLWLAGWHAEWPHGIASIGLSPSAADPWPALPRGAVTTEPRLASVALGDPIAANGAPLLLGIGPVLQRATSDRAGRVADVERIATIESSHPILLAPGRAGIVYAAAARDGDRSVILRLSVQPSLVGR